MRVECDGINRLLPDFMIVGAAKAATTSLYYYLKQHPKVFFPVIKEPFYFSYCSRDPVWLHKQSEIDKTERITDLASYCQLYESAPVNSLLGDASTQYLYDSEAVISNIKSHYGELHRKIKIIVVLRNPVDRAWSMYSMHKRDGKEPLSFEDAIDSETINLRMRNGWPDSYDYIGFGCYYQSLLNYSNSFDNVLILLQEDLSERPADTLNKIYAFLDIQTPIDADYSTRFNQSGSPKNRLAAFVADFIYKDNYIKMLLKKIVPKQVRYNIRTYASSYLFKKDGLDLTVRKKVVLRYINDINSVESLINRNLQPWKE